MVGGDHSRFELNVPQGSGLEWKIGSYIILACLSLCCLICLVCLVGISIGIHFFLAKVPYLFHWLVPGLRFGI